MAAAAAERISRVREGVHRREHKSVLAAAEKRLLVWMARRLPLWVTSDGLTALAAVAMIGAGGAFAAAPWSRWSLALVPVFLAINWFGDSLDGTTARVRGQERPRYGFYIDHVVDLFSACVLFGGMAASGVMHPVIALGVLAGYVVVAGESFLATHTLGVFRVSFSGVGPTELRLLLSLGALVAIARPIVHPFGIGAYQLFDVGGVVAIAGMAVAFIASVVRNGRALHRDEPLPASRR